MCKLGKMCDQENGIDCLHYVLYIGDSKHRPLNQCGSKELCDTVVEKFKTDDGNDDNDYEADIECKAIKQQITASIGAITIALYLAM